VTVPTAAALPALDRSSTSVNRAPIIRGWSASQCDIVASLSDIVLAAMIHFKIKISEIF